MQLTTSVSRVGDHLTTARRAPALTMTLIVTAGALGLTFELDRLTDSAPVQHLYYLPIVFGALRFGRRGGLITSMVAIVLYHLANPHLLTFRYGQSDLVQMALFIGIGWITAKLTGDAKRLQALAMTDDLTGLHNLRSFEAHLVTMVRDARKSNAPLALLALDLDRLKSLNDRYGHLAGAEAVRTVGHIIASLLPPAAVACRYGGDEFVMAIPGCTLSRAHAVAQALCSAVNDEAPVLAGIAFAACTLSISVGVACRSFGDHTAMPDVLEGDVETGKALFRAADKALYAAKEGGRNQVWKASQSER
jgi:diguanylate cyclase (GGDEF)-like protein